MAKKRKCIVCGTAYEYCPRCEIYRKQPSWKILYCRDDCHEISIIKNNFDYKHIDALEAKELLDSLDLERELTPPYKEFIELIEESSQNYAEEIVDVDSVEIELE